MTKQEAAEDHIKRNGSTYNGLKVGNIRKADFLAGVEHAEEKALILKEALEKIGKLTTKPQENWEEIWDISHNSINAYNKSL